MFEICADTCIVLQLVSTAFAVLALISFVQMHRVHNTANFSGGRQIRGPMAGTCLLISRLARSKCLVSDANMKTNI